MENRKMRERKEGKEKYEVKSNREEYEKKENGWFVRAPLLVLFLGNEKEEVYKELILGVL